MAAKKNSAQSLAKQWIHQSMGCLPVGTHPGDNAWINKIKHDGFRLKTIKRNDETTLFLLRGSLLDQQFPNTDAHEGISSL